MFPQKKSKLRKCQHHLNFDKIKKLKSFKRSAFAQHDIPYWQKLNLTLHGSCMVMLHLANLFKFGYIDRLSKSNERVEDLKI